MPPKGSAHPPSVGREADQLETELNQARLTIDQEIGIWDVWQGHGLPAARHVLTAMKEARQPLLIKQKVAMTPADAFDRIGQQVAAALRTAATQPGASQAQVEQAARAFIAQLVPVGGRATLTDSGDQSVMPSKGKAYDPARDGLAIALNADQVKR